MDLLTETLATRRRATARSTPRSLASTSATTMRRWLGPMLREASPAELAAPPDRRRPQRRGARWLRAGHLAAGRRRLPDRPAAQPAVHPRLLGVGPRPRDDHVAGDAGPVARDPADRADLHLAPALRRHPALHGWRNEHVEGGDVLLLAPGCWPSASGERTTPAGAEQLAREVFAAGLAHTVLAVPIAQERATMHLDTVCTMVDVDKVVMYPNVADTLTAYAVTRRRGAGDRADGLELHVAEASTSWSPPPRRWASTPCTDRHRPRPGHRRARAVGRRQQHAGRRAAGGGRLRAQRRDQRPARGGRHRGGADRRIRVGLGPRRAAVHELPDRPGVARLTLPLSRAE